MSRLEDSSDDDLPGGAFVEIETDEELQAPEPAKRTARYAVWLTLLAILGFVALFGRVGWQNYQASRASDILAAAGVYIDPDASPARLVSTVDTFGDEKLLYVARLNYPIDVSIYNSELITNAGLEHLAGNKNIVGLTVGSKLISDEGLVHLSGMTGLRKLSLVRANISDEGLKHLLRLTVLEELTLDGTQVSDQGLEHLRTLHNLKCVVVRATRVTRKGEALLEKSLPDVVVIH